MKYLCLAYYDEKKYKAMTSGEFQAIERQCPPHDAVLQASGKLLLVGSLSDPATAACIRPKGGKPTVTDGPFIETHEQVGSAFIIEADSRAEAIEVASKHPAAHLGEQVGWGIELREIEFFQAY